MEAVDRGFSALSQALLEQGFRAVDEFDAFVTFARDCDPLRIHIGPDGSFTVFDSTDKCITEGAGAEDLYRLLVAKPAPINRPPQQRDRRTRSNARPLRIEAVVRR
jgi:hypothetical protein